MSRWTQKLERWAQPLAFPHLLIGIIIGQTFFYLVTLLGLFDESRIWFAWSAVLAGEWWRLLTFAISPPDVHWAFFAFVIYCLYSLGGALEAEWGLLRFNLFLITGWFLTVAAAALVPGQVMGNGFIGVSIFLAFAYLNPNYVFQIYFIFPVRAKYLALITLFLYTLGFYSGGLSTRLAILASLGNCLIFLGPQLLNDVRGGRRQLAFRSRQAAAKREVAAAGPRHRCVVCGKDSDTHPDEDFRYRADDRCYCSAHLRTPLATAPVETPR
jgi:hypothetical protein